MSGLNHNPDFPQDQLWELFKAHDEGPTGAQEVA